MVRFNAGAPKKNIDASSDDRSSKRNGRDRSVRACRTLSPPRYNLGRVFYHGLLGQRANRRNARLLFEKAAKRREKCAQAALGYMYEKGEGRCRKRPAERTTSLSRSNRSRFGCFLDGSCSLGEPFPESQTLVSKLFDKQHIDVGLHIFVSRPGEGDLKTDYNHAKRYYGMAANQGCERSAFNLGHLFEKGLVITENDVVRYALAKQWYERAEALGYARAEQRIAHIATLDAASPEPTVEEKKKEADSDVDEMMDSDNDGDDENEPGAGRGSEGASILGSLNIR